MRGRGLSRPERYIASEAAMLLRDYERENGRLTGPPVPVDDILETHLGLSMNYADLRHRFGERGLLGATVVPERAIYIDKSLDPTHFPEREGRYNFTLAHEIGHWCLHRLSAPDRPHLLLDSFDCDPADLHGRREWQANHFASCLLMPFGMLREAWLSRHGDFTPAVYVTRRRTPWPVRPDRDADVGEIESEGFRRVQELAQLFRVSFQAMRIRLQAWGLIEMRPQVRAKS
jgi:hypothetical protein